MNDLITDLVISLTTHLTTYLLIFITTAIIYFIFTQLTNRDTWENYGVKQVSMGRLALVDFKRASAALMEEHGDTVGITRGEMTLITRDLELLRHVMVKDFNNFVDRMVVMTTNTPIEDSLFFSNGQDWRRMRHLSSPSFSTGKLKYVARNIESSAQKLANILEDCAGKDVLVPIKHITGQYTSEIIASSAFGVQTDCLGKEDDEFTHHAKSIIKIRSKAMNMLILVMFRFKWLHRFLVKKLKISFLDQMSGDAYNYFNAIIHTAVAQRLEMEQQGLERPKDFLQSMIVAKTKGDEEAAHYTSDSQEASWEQLPKTMTDRELIGQSMLVIFAGFETTATTLQMCLFLLAQHADIQEKVYKEIQKVVSSESPTYEELGQLKYTEQVINETLRHYPPAAIITRRAEATYHYGSITIPKGAGILIPIETIMMDPRNYPDPTKFDPDRFSDENKVKRDPLTFLPFGYGPRHCIGMRLAYLELKVGLVHVLRKVKFELNDRTEPRKGEKLVTRFQGIIVIDKPIQLQAKLRNE
ncbi:unnamed protein product [Lymnaea stagnalis]|uniref:Cytochrome P450 n=1 Tax=Lymnaea stagnalis TaxID=6523 RepID=A0AAV2H808_LYMST